MCVSQVVTIVLASAAIFLIIGDYFLVQSIEYFIHKPGYEHMGEKQQYIYIYMYIPHPAMPAVSSFPSTSQVQAHYAHQLCNYVYFCFVTCCFHYVSVTCIDTPKSTWTILRTRLERKQWLEDFKKFAMRR